MTKLRIVGFYLACLMMVALTGCSSDSDADATAVDNSLPPDADVGAEMDVPDGDGDTPGP